MIEKGEELLGNYVGKKQLQVYRFISNLSTPFHNFFVHFLFIFLLGFCLFLTDVKELSFLIIF